MIDLHCHVLPGMDDGAPDLDTSLEMLMIAQTDGIDSIVATPHFIAGEYNNNTDAVLQKLDELKTAAEVEGIFVKLYPGNELYIDPGIPALLKEGSVCTLNNSSYVLVEFPMADIPAYAADTLYHIRLEGYTPIIAHPERNQKLGGDPDLLIEMIDAGALCQVNSSSITGIFGNRIKRTAFDMLRHGMVHLVGSDAHTAGGRAPRLAKARELVAADCGEELAVKLFEANAQAVMEDRAIDTGEPSRVRRLRRRFFLPFR